VRASLCLSICDVVPDLRKLSMNDMPLDAIPTANFFYNKIINKSVIGVPNLERDRKSNGA
jgi:hypothetical protein